MTKTRQETDDVRDTQYSIGHAPKRIRIRATVANQLTAASKPVRARLLWATLSLVLPVTFGHITACRSAALTLSAEIHFVMKNSAPCFAVLRSRNTKPFTLCVGVRKNSQPARTTKKQKQGSTFLNRRHPSTSRRT